MVLTFAGDVALILVFCFFGVLALLTVFLPRKIDITITPTEVQTDCVLRRRVLLPPLTVLCLWIFYTILFLELPWWVWQYRQLQDFDSDPLNAVCQWDQCFRVNTLDPYHVSVLPNTEAIRVHKIRLLAEAWYKYGRLVDGREYWETRENFTRSIAPAHEVDPHIVWRAPEYAWIHYMWSLNGSDIAPLQFFRPSYQDRQSWLAGSKPYPDSPDETSSHTTVQYTCAMRQFVERTVENLVVGVAINTTLQDVMPFVSSLRSHQLTHTDVVLVTDDTFSPFLDALYIKKNNVTILSCPNAFDLASHHGPPSKDMIAHIIVSDFLDNVKSYRNVLVARNIEQIVFQKDPFVVMDDYSSSSSKSSSSIPLDTPHTGLYVGLENRVFGLQMEAVTGALDCYGVPTAFFLAPFTLSSSKIVLGSLQDVTNYANVMKAQVENVVALSKTKVQKPKRTLRSSVVAQVFGEEDDSDLPPHRPKHCSDERVLHNTALYTGKLGDPRTIHSLSGNGDDMISLEAWPWKNLPKVDKNGHVKSKNGKLVPIVINYQLLSKASSKIQKKYLSKVKI